MSSEDFFNQSFSPAKKGKRGPPPPPPPPPPTSTSSSTIRSRPNKGSTSTSSTSSSIRATSAAAAAITKNSTATKSTSSGYYATAGANRGLGAAALKPARPTGNYYATTNDAPAPAPSFHAYGGASTSTSTDASANSVGGTGGYNHAPSMDVQQDWFTTANANTTPATNYMNPSGSSSSNSMSSMNNNMNSSNPNFQASIPAPSPYQQQPQQQPQQQQQQHSQQTQQQYQPQGQNGFFSGTMDTNANSEMSGPMMMQPSTSNTTNNPSNNKNKQSLNSSSSYHRYTYNPDDFADEPPLLEELGINISHIQTKSLAVILPVRYAKQAINQNLMEDSDMAGPIAFAILLALELLLAGRIHFGYIYGFGLFGCFATTLIINLMSPSDAISIWTVVSILGYSLLPVNMLAALNVFYRIRLMGDLGVILGTITIAWCTLSSTRLFEKGCGLRDQRYLIGYPNALLYSAFVLLTIF